MELRIAGIPDPPAIMRPAQLARLTLLAREINAAHTAGVQAVGQGVEYYRSAGLWLIEAKVHCGGKGYWLDWLDANIAIDCRQAQKYMRLAKCAPAGAHLVEEWQTICGRVKADSAEDDLEEELEGELGEELDKIGDEEDAAAEEAAGYAAPPAWQKQLARMLKHLDKAINPANAFDRAQAGADRVIRALEYMELARQELAGLGKA
jgi:hypothetical protein